MHAWFCVHRSTGRRQKLAAFFLGDKRDPGQLHDLIDFGYQAPVMLQSVQIWALSRESFAELGVRAPGRKMSTEYALKPTRTIGKIYRFGPFVDVRGLSAIDRDDAGDTDLLDDSRRIN